MTILVRVLVIAFLIAMSALVLVPSFQVYCDLVADLEVEPPQQVPQPPAEINETSVAIYAQQVETYAASISAYKELLQAASTPAWHASYALVVKDTISGIFSKIVAALIAFAFVKAGARVVDNAFRMRNKLEPKDISLF